MMTYPPNLIPSCFPAAENTYSGSRPQDQCLDMQNSSSIITPLSSTDCPSGSYPEPLVSGLGISTPLCTSSSENIETPIPRNLVPKITPESQIPTRKSKIEKAKHLISSFSARRHNSIGSKLHTMHQTTPHFVGGGYSGIPSHHVDPSTYSPQCFSPTPASTWPISNSTRTHRTHLNAPSQPMLRRQRSGTLPARLNHSADMLPLEKPQASTTNGSVTMTIRLHSPILFQQGLDPARDSDENREGVAPAMLRGQLLIRIMKPTNIKAITLTFKGKAVTKWPEGLPPKRSEFYEEKTIMYHTWPFFNAKFSTAYAGHLADSYIPRDIPAVSGGVKSFLNKTPRDSEDKTGFRMQKSKSLSKDDDSTGSIHSKGYRIFQPGDYIYSFELPIDSNKPETINTEYGTVRYHLEGCIERVNSFGIKSSLYGKREVQVVRVPSDTNMEQSEPIAITRSWDDQLHYDIVISGKAFPLGSTMPMAMKLTPLQKCRIHRVRCYITEAVEYTAMDGKVHRIIEPKKIPLFDKRPDKPIETAYKGTAMRVTAGGGFKNSDFQNGPINDPYAEEAVSLIGDLSGQQTAPSTELEFDIVLPSCDSKGKNKIHHNTSYKSILVNHWIKVVIRISKADTDNPERRRFFEITIDSPLHILSCHVTNPNTTLPLYGAPAAETIDRRAICNCATNREAILSAPMNRPMHLIRAPSNLPPDYDEDSSPPPCMTPPPNYEGLFRNTDSQSIDDRMDDYFSRREIELGEEPEMQLRRGMMLPLTPGRAGPSRSFDEPRRRWGEELDARP
ncbi:hypothetical protein BZA77DRAFT_150493 [Pyronema omphalodes]|nr:hypothetical protein BZA77DRAFT_150493 [Pyronema omphalodes]